MSNESKTITEEKTSGPTEHVVTIVSTKGAPKKITYRGDAWKGLHDAIIEAGYDLSNMKCVESTNRTTLEHHEARLPEGNFNLFLMPYKSKSGGDLTRPEAYQKIKKFINKDGDSAKEHFAKYTNRSTADLNEAIEAYSPGTKKRVTKAKAEAIADVAQSVKGSSSKEEAVSHLEGLTSDEKLDVIIHMLVGMKGGSGSSEATVAEATPAKPVKSEADIEAERKEQERLEQKRKDDEEAEKLNQEMVALGRGFNDVSLSNRR